MNYIAAASLRLLAMSCVNDCDSAYGIVLENSQSMGMVERVSSGEKAHLMDV